MKIHLIGIGGIGVSALAQYYLAKGHIVSGSDLVASEITDMLKQKGISVFIGTNIKNINKDLDLIVYSPAVKKDNPELLQAESCKIQAKSYPEALGELTKEYYTIAIAGAHGKSTTTSMIALALTTAGLDPTVIVGTKIKEFGENNFRFGQSKILVIEACEYDSSFLYYSPKIIVLTNIDKEHLDYFKTFANVKKAFLNFVKKLPNEGHLIVNGDDFFANEISNYQFPSYNQFLIHKFSINQEEFKKIKKIMKVPGEHNARNALAVLEVCRILVVPDNITYRSLSKFNGTWRRFEEKNAKIKNLKFKIISDYAHHPNEIEATFSAVREKYPNKKIWCVFQPHQHQRTHYLFKDFVKTFRNTKVDNIIITDIYDVVGRENKKINKTTSSEELVRKIKKNNVIYCAINNLEKYIKENISSGDVLIIMGAGDIYKLYNNF